MGCPHGLGTRAVGYPNLARTHDQKLTVILYVAQPTRAPAWIATASWAAMSTWNQPAASTVTTGPVQDPLA